MLLLMLMLMPAAGKQPQADMLLLMLASSKAGKQSTADKLMLTLMQVTLSPLSKSWRSRTEPSKRRAESSNL